MPSNVDISNLALVMLGQSRIIAFTDQTKSARSINAIYAMTRDDELRANRWTFAVARTILPALANFTPAYGFQWAYQKPADCLSIISIGDIAPGSELSIFRGGQDEVQYRVEGETILHGRLINGLPLPVVPPNPPMTPTPLKLRYVRHITDPTMFDANFVTALSSMLAWKLAEELTQSKSKKADAMGAYQMAISRAKRGNSIELPPEILNDGSWLRSRLPG